MTDKNISGQAYALTVLTPILPGREQALRSHLEQLPTGWESPIIKRGKTHFTRLVVIPQLIWEGPPQKRDHLHSQYLLWECNFDGANLDAYLEDLAMAPDDMDAIWGHCVGYPGARNRDRFIEYMRHNQIETAFYFAPYGDIPVPEVLDALELRAKILNFALSSRDLDADGLYNAYLETFSERPALTTSATS